MLVAVATPTVGNNHPKHKSEDVIEIHALPGSPAVSEHLRAKGTQTQGGRPLDKGLLCSGEDSYRSIRKATIKFIPHI